MQSYNESEGPGLIKMLEVKNRNSRYADHSINFDKEELYPASGPKYAQYAEIINCNFSHNRARESAIMHIGDSYVRIAASQLGKSVIFKNEATYNGAVFDIKKNSFLALENL